MTVDLPHLAQVVVDRIADPSRLLEEHAVLASSEVQGQLVDFAESLEAAGRFVAAFSLRRALILLHFSTFDYSRHAKATLNESSWTHQFDAVLAQDPAGSLAEAIALAQDDHRPTIAALLTALDEHDESALLAAAIDILFRKASAFSRTELGLVLLATVVPLNEGLREYRQLPTDAQLWIRTVGLPVVHAYAEIARAFSNRAFELACLEATADALVQMEDSRADAALAVAADLAMNLADAFPLLFSHREARILRQRGSRFIAADDVHMATQTFLLASFAFQRHACVTAPEQEVLFPDLERLPAESLFSNGSQLERCVGAANRLMQCSKWSDLRTLASDEPDLTSPEPLMWLSVFAAEASSYSRLPALHLSRRVRALAFLASPDSCVLGPLSLDIHSVVAPWAVLVRQAMIGSQSASLKVASAAAKLSGEAKIAFLLDRLLAGPVEPSALQEAGKWLVERTQLTEQFCLALLTLQNFDVISSAPADFQFTAELAGVLSAFEELATEAQSVDDIPSEARVLAALGKLRLLSDARQHALEPLCRSARLYLAMLESSPLCAVDAIDAVLAASSHLLDCHEATAAQQLLGAASGALKKWRRADIELAVPLASVLADEARAFGVLGDSQSALSRWSEALDLVATSDSDAADRCVAHLLNHLPVVAGNAAPREIQRVCLEESVERYEGILKAGASRYRTNLFLARSNLIALLLNSEPRDANVAEARRLVQANWLLLDRVKPEIDSLSFERFRAQALVQIATSQELSGEADGVDLAALVSAGDRLAALPLDDETLSARAALLLTQMRVRLRGGDREAALVIARGAVDLLRGAQHEGAELGEALVLLDELESEADGVFRLTARRLEALDLLRRSGAVALLTFHLDRIGLALFEDSAWSDAIPLLSEAATLVRQRLRETLGRLERTQHVEQHGRLCEALTICYVRVGDTLNAMEAAEAGHCHTVADAIARRSNASAAPMLGREGDALFTEAADRLAVSDYSASTSKGSGARLRDVYQDQWRRSTTSNVEPVSGQHILALSSALKTVVLIFDVTRQGTFIFVALPDGRYFVVEHPEFDRKRLNSLMIFKVHPEDDTYFGWLSMYMGSRDAANSDEMTHAAAVHEWFWHSTITETLKVVSIELLGPVRALLAEACYGAKDADAASLVLVPTGALRWLPLAAANWTEDGQPGDGRVRESWLDRFSVRVSPSVTALAYAYGLDRGRTCTGNIVAVSTLSSFGSDASVVGDWEIDELEKSVAPDRYVGLCGAAASLDNVLAALSRAERVHFSCHGRYEIQDRLGPSLVLTGGDELTLDVILGLRLRCASLITMAACDSGLTDPTDVDDQLLGLALGFLLAGAPTVWASLWHVDDLATGLLMTRAYEALASGMSKADALRAAQLWTRNLTVGEIDSKLLEMRQKSATGVPDLVSPVWRLQRARFCMWPPDARPFEHPYYWAAFQNIGL